MRVTVHEVTASGVTRHEDRLATEEPLEIRVEWPGHPADRVTVTMRTPGHDFELAAGWLFHERLVAPEDIRTVAYCTDVSLAPEEEFNVVTVGLSGPTRRPVPDRYAGLTAGSSACGVCGKQSIEEALATSPAPGVAASPEAARVPERPGSVVSAAVVRALPERLREAQRVFDSTGGLHAAGLFDLDGTPLVVREDVGRHNAVDKVVGARLLAGAPLGSPLLCLSGRVGFELVQKAVASGVSAVVAVGAPSSLAVRLAEQAGVGLAGFTREGRYVVYAAPARFGV